MKITTLKELEQVIKLCRKTGVQSITVDGVQLQLGEAPSKPSTATNTDSSKDAEPQYSDNDYMFWSSEQVS